MGRRRLLRSFTIVPILTLICSLPGRASAMQNDEKTVPESDGHLQDLVDRLGDDQYDVREAATKEIIAIGKRATPCLEQATKGEDPEIRARATTILKILPIRERVSINDALWKEFPQIYEDLLAGSENKAKIIDLLQEVTRTDNKGTTVHPVTGADVAGIVRELFLNGPAPLTREQKILVCDLCGKKRISKTAPSIRTMLKDGDAGIRSSAVLALGYMQDKESIADIKALLNDDDPDVRTAAAGALGYIGAIETIPEIRKLLGGDYKDKSRIFMALVRLKATEAIPDITKLLEDKNEWTRYYAALSLGMMQSKESVPRLIKMLDDENVMARGGAIDALGTLHATEAAPKIIELMKDKDPSIRWPPADALGSIGAKVAIPELKQRLEDEHPHVRAWAAISLVKLGAKDAVPKSVIRDLQGILRDAWMDMGSTYPHRVAIYALRELGVPDDEIDKMKPQE